MLTTDEFRTFETSALGDEPLQVLLDAAEAEIVRYGGPEGAAVEWFDGGQRFLFLARPAASITSIVETTIYNESSTTLAADDYIVHPGGFRIQRIGTGTNALWRWQRGRVVVTYVPVADEALRESVQLDLIKLALHYQPGTVSETIGAWHETFRQAMESNEEERNEILCRLSPGPSLVVVGG